MKHVNNYLKQNKLMVKWEEFLCSKDRMMPIFATQDSELRAKWHEQEAKALKRFAMRCDKEFFVQYLSNPSSEITALTLMERFHHVAMAIKDAAPDTALTKRDTELRALSASVQALLVKIANETHEHLVRMYVIDHLCDGEALQEIFEHHRFRDARILAGRRIHALEAQIAV